MARFGEGASAHGGGSANRKGKAGYGTARPGLAWLGVDRQGKGTSVQWWRFRKSSRLGVARRGMAGQGKVWQGERFYFQTLTKD